MSNSFSELLLHLLHVSPMLVMYVVGVVVALVKWKRFPRACMLTLIAMSVMLFTGLGQIYFYSYIADTRLNRGFDEYIRLMRVIGVASAVLHACGLGLLLWAVFAGRSMAAGRGFPMLHPPGFGGPPQDVGGPPPMMR